MGRQDLISPSFFILMVVKIPLAQAPLHDQFSVVITQKLKALPSGQGSGSEAMPSGQLLIFLDKRVPNANNLGHPKRVDQTLQSGWQRDGILLSASNWA